MRYPDSVQFLYALGNEIKTVKFGLESIQAVLQELGNPQDGFRSIHVAGTNGKGSTCAMIESGLRAAGFRTGLYTSPHLVEPTERIRIAGVPVSPEQFADTFRTVHDANERLIAARRLEHHTTYFETVTAMGFLLMKDLGVEIGVIETGLGGRLDATNVLHPEICVITPIDFDHEQYLGSSLHAIAGEKAGILKRGAVAVFAAQRTEAGEVLETRAGALDMRVVHTGEYNVQHLQVHAHGSDFTAVRQSPVRVRCPLAGEHQVENAVASIAALECMGLSAGAIEKGIGATRWPGRLERISERPEILLDGAHNPAGARALAAHLRSFYEGRKIRLIYGAMRDKSVEEITEILFPLAQEVILTAPDSARAVRPEALLKELQHQSVRIADTAEAALRIAFESEPEDVMVITGSLYLIGEVKRLLQ